MTKAGVALKITNFGYTEQQALFEVKKHGLSDIEINQVMFFITNNKKYLAKIKNDFEKKVENACISVTRNLGSQVAHVKITLEDDMRDGMFTETEAEELFKEIVDKFNQFVRQ